MRDRKPTYGRKRESKKQAPAHELGFYWGPANWVLLSAGVVAVAAGYFALSRGSTTLAPVLLVVGYCGLVPASLLVRRRAEPAGE